LEHRLHDAPLETAPLPDSISLMLAEIREQPEAIQRLLDHELSRVAQLADAARARNVSLLFLAARGTSDHAAVYAKYLVEILAGLPVALAAPSVFTLYDARVRLEGALVLGISQSGKAADAIEVLKRARDSGQLTGCITNDPESPMAGAAEHPLYCHARVERSLPATKTYTTSLALVYALAAELGGRQDLLDDLRRAPDLVRQALALEEQVAEGAERYRYMEECVVLARGINQCSALEAALKLSETSYLRAHPYSAADFLHGPIAVVEEGYPCFLFAPGGRGCPAMLEVAGELRKRNAELLILSDRQELLDQARTPLPMPAAPELLTPLVGIVIAQLFAYHLARVKGRDPDRPRGLNKVTHTF
jgi:glutamine---fructose-6-phosphate transaminase (isomerizing)